MSNDDLERVAKHLPDSWGRKAGKVLPDLVIYERSSSTALANLLVTEAKVAPTDRSFDYGKLPEYQAELGYRFAVFLELPTFPEAT